MAYFLFTSAILEGRNIDLFNCGDMRRDFTYIDDVVEVITRILDVIPNREEDQQGGELHPGISPAPFRIYNVGRHETVSLISFVQMLEKELGRKANTTMLPMQSGDVPNTHADVSQLEKIIGFTPTISLQDGIRRFVQWFTEFY